MTEGAHYCGPGIFRIIHVGGKDYLSVLTDGEYFRFGPLTEANLLRLIAESSDRLLSASLQQAETQTDQSPSH